MYTCAYVCVLAHVLCDNNNGCYLGIDRSRPARFVGEAVQHQTPARAASRIPAALLAVLALALDPLVGAHAFAAAEARLMLLCSQMLAPPQSLQVLLGRFCSQMQAPGSAQAGWKGPQVHSRGRACGRRTRRTRGMLRLGHG